MDDGQQLQRLPTQEIQNFSYINSSNDDEDGRVTPEVDEHIALGYEDLEVPIDEADEEEANTSTTGRKHNMADDSTKSNRSRSKCARYMGRGRLDI